MAEKFTSVIALSFALLFVTVAYASEEESEDSDKVVIETISPAPEDCVRKAKRHDQLSMHYVGFLTATGKKFDSSHDRGQPFVFQLGVGQVIKGWDQGLVDMCVGEKRKLTIPPSLAYGETGAGELIPPNSKLTFEVDLLTIEDGQAPPNIFADIDTDADRQLSREEISHYIKKQSEKAGHVPEEEHQHFRIIDEIFNHEDKDKDGFISHEEFSGPKHDEL